MAAIALALLLAVSQSRADARPNYSKSYAACMAKAESTLAMDDCNKGELGRRTLLLDKAFQDALGRIGDGLRPRVRAAERSWIASRDADCDLYEDREEFGSFGIVLGGQCMIDRTISRTKDLRAMFPSPAGRNS